VIPVRTRASNFVYRGPTPDIGDAWVERRPAGQAVMLTWRPSEQEREAIAAGALVELGIYHVEPIPPVSVNVSSHREISAIGATLRDRAAAELRKLHVVRYTDSAPPGYWAVSDDVWEDLQASEALDPSNGVPKLLGRPLVTVEDAVGAFDYVVSDSHRS
jgi:hypothetical protein